MSALREFMAGLAKAVLVHRHAFIPGASATRALGARAALPASFAPAVEECFSAGERAWARAEAHAAAGRWRRAEAEAERLARGGDRGARVVLGLLRLLGRADPSRRGLEALLCRLAHSGGERELARAAESGFWPAWCWLGLARLRACDLSGARAALDALAAARPNWPWSHIVRSELGRVDIEFAPALRDLARALELEPGNAWAFALRSRVRFQAGPGPDGLADLDRAVELAPRAGWMLAWRGDARRKLGDLKGALSDLMKARAFEPAYDRTYLWLGKTLLALGAPERAAPVLDEAVRRCPHFEKAFAERARLRLSLGRAPAAAQDMRRAAAVNHRHDFLGSWGAEPYPPSAAQRAAAAALQAWVRRAPRSAWARAWLGETCVQLGETARGLAELDAALALKPRLAWARAWRGEALVRLGRPAEGEAELSRALALDPGYGRAHAWRGRARALLGRPKAALADFDKSVGDSLVEYSWLYHWRAEALLALGRREQARRDADTAVSLEPRRPEFARLAQACRA